MPQENELDLINDNGTGEKNMSDALGQAILDYHLNDTPGRLWIHNTYNRKESMPVKIYFRNEKHMPELELIALGKCKGSILEIGAGAGSHALLLQERGFEITALDISGKACKVMKLRGVQNVVKSDYKLYTEKQFDTILLLMNGVGLTGSLAGLSKFFARIKTQLKPGGQLLFDSSDVAYLYDWEVPYGNEYYGEISYEYEYKDKKTGWFKWLYVDMITMKKIAKEHGFKVKILYEDTHNQYLARLTL